MSSPIHGSDFTVYPISATKWCAYREDGLVCGFFVDQACALRFARREARGGSTITVRREPPDAAFAARAA
jgi:hypothetical protein